MLLIVWSKQSFRPFQKASTHCLGPMRMYIYIYTHIIVLRFCLGWHTVGAGRLACSSRLLLSSTLQVLCMLLVQPHFALLYARSAGKVFALTSIQSLPPLRTLTSMRVSVYRKLTFILQPTPPTCNILLRFRDNCLSLYPYFPGPDVGIAISHRLPVPRPAPPNFPG